MVLEISKKLLDYNGFGNFQEIIRQLFWSIALWLLKSDFLMQEVYVWFLYNLLETNHD